MPVAESSAKTSDVASSPTAGLTAAVPTGATAGVAAAVMGYRWRILALLFFATTINYVDRQVLGILAPTLQREFSWSETDYGAIVSWFSFAYGIGLLLTGRVLDIVGTRLGFSVAIVT